jgi:hypothetical protein
MKTCAMPVWGPRRPIQVTDVPVKVKVAVAPDVLETVAVPPLHAARSMSPGLQPPV